MLKCMIIESKKALFDKGIILTASPDLRLLAQPYGRGDSTKDGGKRPDGITTCGSGRSGQ